MLVKHRIGPVKLDILTALYNNNLNGVKPIKSVAVLGTKKSLNRAHKQYRYDRLIELINDGFVSYEVNKNGGHECSITSTGIELLNSKN